MNNISFLAVVYKVHEKTIVIVQIMNIIILKFNLSKRNPHKYLDDPLTIPNKKAIIHKGVVPKLLTLPKALLVLDIKKHGTINQK